MKRFIAAGLIGGLLCSGAGILQADPAAAPQDLSQYLATLQVKLAHTAQRANQPSSGSSSVVGLRGAQQQSGAKQLYWKGVDGDTAAVNPPEVKLFRTAVDQARDGKKSDAIATLQEFQKTYPKSALIPDVDETLNRLTTAEAPPAVPAITPSATQSVPAHS